MLIPMEKSIVFSSFRDSSLSWKKTHAKVKSYRNWLKTRVEVGKNRIKETDDMYWIKKGKKK